MPALKLHEALVHHRRALGEVRAEAHAVGVGDAHAGRHDVVGHARELVDAEDLQRLAGGAEAHARPRRARPGRPGPRLVQATFGSTPKTPSRLSAVRRDEPVREQVQAQVGVVGVGGRRVEVVDHGRRPSTAARRAASSLGAGRELGRRARRSRRRAPSCGSGKQHVEHPPVAGRASPVPCPQALASSARHASWRARPRRRGTAQPVEVDVQVLVDVDLSSPPSSSTVTGESPPRSTWATAAPQAPVPERLRLPHAALEDPRADAVGRELGPERHVRAVGEARRRARSAGRSRPGRAPRARRASATRIALLRVADRDVLEAPARRSRPRRSSARAAHVDAARVLAGDRRADLARGGLDRERARVGPAALGAGRGSPRARRCPTARPRSRRG